LLGNVQPQQDVVQSQPFELDIVGPRQQPAERRLELVKRLGVTGQLPVDDRPDPLGLGSYLRDQARSSLPVDQREQLGFRS
jgi:hypothetical protein